MRRARLALTLALLALTSSCIASSVLDPAERAPQSQLTSVAWSPVSLAEIPGTYVSSEITGALASVLGMVVYRFDEAGSYTGAALLNDAPPRFEVITGQWRLDAENLLLDDAPPALIEVAEDGSLRMTGEGGAVLLRREVAR